MTKTILLLFVAFFTLGAAVLIGPRASPRGSDRAVAAVARPTARLPGPLELEVRAQPRRLEPGARRRVALTLAPRARPAEALAVVVDRSGSMAEAGGDAMRRARDEVRRVAEARGARDVFALVSCASDVTTDIPLQSLPLGENRLRRAIADLLPGGRTHLDAGIDRALEVLADRPPLARPRILLVTDGRPMQPGAPDRRFEHALDRARAAGVAVEVLELGPSLGRAKRSKASASAPPSPAPPSGAPLARLCVRLPEGVRLAGQRPGAFVRAAEAGCDVAWVLPPTAPIAVGRGAGPAATLQLEVDAASRVQALADVRWSVRGAPSRRADLRVATELPEPSIWSTFRDTVAPGGPR